jgi:phage FluMu protein Com
MEERNSKDVISDLFTYRSARTEAATEKTFLEMKCPSCGTLNLIPVNRIIYHHESQDPKTDKTTTLYEPKGTTKCRHCDATMADPQELIRAE